MRASRKAYGSNSFFQSYNKILYHQQEKRLPENMNFQGSSHLNLSKVLSHFTRASFQQLPLDFCFLKASMSMKLMNNAEEFCYIHETQKMCLKMDCQKVPSSFELVFMIFKISVEHSHADLDYYASTRLS